MGILIDGLTNADGLILAAASAASAAVTDMIEVSRDDTIAGDLRFRETAETLCDALQSVCSIELEDDEMPADRREEMGQLIAAVSRFIEGWAG